jgi:hypothetical protein
MSSREFEAFRLVGGTALSLMKGHRKSVDIDLFTDAPYGSIDFDSIDLFLRKTYNYVDAHYGPEAGMGRSYFAGSSLIDCIKLDLFYTDEFMDKMLLMDEIRFAGIDELIAMKLDVISRGGRKKDYWDIHELMDEYTLDQMLDLHKRRYPYTHDKAVLLNRLVDFNNADNDFDPICLRGKYWEIIKLDLIDLVQRQQ